MCASVILLQALWRDLKADETRAGLVRKCIRLLDAENRGVLVKPFPCVLSCTHDLSLACKDAEVKPPAAPPADPPAEGGAPSAKKPRK